MGRTRTTSSATCSACDPKTGETTLLYKEVNGHPLSAPNDLVFDKEGGFYFTDLGKRYPRHRDNGGVYYALPDGSKVVEIAYPILSPNGCGLSPDGKTLYVADTEGARLWAFEVQGPGKLKPKSEFAPHSGQCIAGLSGNARFDSLKVMASGNITDRNAQHRLCHRDLPGRQIVRAVKMPDVYPTNICFGGADMRTAYITLSDKATWASCSGPSRG